MLRSLVAQLNISQTMVYRANINTGRADYKFSK